ncbi:hypothetical protein DFJ74DRAFT_708456 [Hyaloraphidium curvatum]|nr:hypothetical protein DFJ74DRAFT_708456 [Hyaloraphidium curvatum]
MAAANNFVGTIPSPAGTISASCSRTSADLGIPFEDVVPGTIEEWPAEKKRILENKINLGTLPWVELPDGRVIGEHLAFLRYERSRLAILDVIEHRYATNPFHGPGPITIADHFTYQTLVEWPPAILPGADARFPELVKLREAMKQRPGIKALEESQKGRSEAVPEMVAQSQPHLAEMYRRVHETIVQASMSTPSSMPSEAETVAVEDSESGSRLPPELYLHVSSFFNPGTQSLLKMMLACRDLYELLLPRFMETFCLEWLPEETAEETVEELGPRGALGFIKTMDLRLRSDRQSEPDSGDLVFPDAHAFVLRQRLPSLSRLSLILSTEELVKAFAVADLTTVGFLDLDIDSGPFLDFEHIRFPSLPALRELKLALWYDARVLAISEAACPNVAAAFMNVMLHPRVHHAASFPNFLLERTSIGQRITRICSAISPRSRTFVREPSAIASDPMPAVTCTRSSGF